MTSASGEVSTAYFTYCQELESTSASECNSNSNAAIYKSGKCSLNAGEPSGTTIAHDGEETFALVYENTNVDNNNGISKLTVI